MVKKMRASTKENFKKLEASRNAHVHVSERRGAKKFEGKPIKESEFAKLVKSATKEYGKYPSVKDAMIDKASKVFESKDIANFRRMTSRQGSVIGIEKAGQRFDDDENSILAYCSSKGLTWKVAGAVLHRSEVSCWAQGQKFGFNMPRGTTLSEELDTLTDAWENAVMYGKLQAAREDGIKIKA